MLFYIIKWFLIYFILVLLIHNLYIFFQNTLTTTKIKDYYNYPNQEYNKISNILNQNKKNNISENNISENNISKLINTPESFDLNNFNNVFENPISNLDSNNMKNELNDFLTKLNK